MLFSRVFAVVAAGVSMVAAQSTTDDGTITMTSTLTQLLTITRCDPAVTACPGNKSTSSTAIYPITNSTTPCTKCAGPTASNPTTVVAPTVTSKTTVPGVPSPAPPASTTGTVVSGGAALIYQSGLLLGAIGAGVALLA